MAARCLPSVTSVRCWIATRASAERPRRAWRSRHRPRTAWIWGFSFDACISENLKREFRCHALRRWSQVVFVVKQMSIDSSRLACFLVVASVHVLRPRISRRRDTCRQDPSAPVSIVPFRIGTSARMPVEDLRAAHAAAVAGATAA